MNNIEFRSDANIVVCKNSTEMFLKSSKPSLEQLSARYYESIPTSSEYTGYTANITFGDFSQHIQTVLQILLLFWLLLILNPRKMFLQMLIVTLI